MTITVLEISLMNYILGLILNFKKSKFILFAGILLNVGILIYFKYANFFIESAASAGFKEFNTLTHVVIPLGISFFTFELVHYLIDIFRGNKAIYNPVSFLNFVLFFPTLFAGPIKRFEQFIPQLYKKTLGIDIFEGTLLIIRGLSKKVLLSDQLSKFSVYAFDLTDNPTIVVIGIYAFGLQIYFDFSAYTDIARGSASFFGIKIPENFLSPYKSKSVAEFWRRWHITLMLWLKDYIYIPLGGSKKGKIRRIINTFIVFTISGLWHGAAWHFVAWGIYHALIVSLQNSLSDIKLFKKVPKLPTFLMIFITFQLVTFGWILFRAQSIPRAFEMIRTIFNFGEYKYLDTELVARLIMISFFISVYLIHPYVSRILVMTGFTKNVARTIIAGFALTIVYLSVNFNDIPFIYFQF